MTMMPGMINSPETSLSAPIDVDDTTIPVYDTSAFPAATAALPNLATIGTGVDAETILYTGKGTGTLTGVTRGYEGIAKAWDADTVVARYIVKEDFDIIQNNLTDIDTRFKTVTTEATTTLYVDPAATGTGDGLSWTNACTTIQAAVNKIPSIVNHQVKILVRKGASAYNETISITNAVTQPGLTSSVITLEAEYYWKGWNASSKTGKFDVATNDPHYADRAQIAAGDYVFLMKYTTAGNQNTKPTEYLSDTVASVSGAEVTLTTNTTKELDTAWYYVICKTAIAGTSLFNMFYVDGLTVRGFDFSTTATIIFSTLGARYALIDACIFGAGCTGAAARAAYFSFLWLTNCLIKNTGAQTTYQLQSAWGCLLKLTQCALTGTSSSYGLYLLQPGYGIVNYCYFDTQNTAVRAIRGSNGEVVGCTISSNSGTGLYTDFGSTIYQSGNTNNATTPKTPASSSDWSHIN